MPDRLEHLHGIAVLVCASEGTVLDTERDALDLIATALHARVRWVAIPTGRLGDEFFRLRTGLAGQILQKFVNYELGIAFLGDISTHTKANSALRDLVRECDRGGQAWFLPDLEALRARLERGRAAGRATGHS